MLDLEQVIVIGLGANLARNQSSILDGLNRAKVRLEISGLKIVNQSSWWSSAAWPNPDDPEYLNGVVLVEPGPGPQEIMQLLQGVENEFGRQRGAANAARTLDLDLIAHGRTVLNSPALILPHPRAAERLFVMGPLAEIAPAWRHPVLNRTAADLASAASVGRDAHPV